MCHRLSELDCFVSPHNLFIVLRKFICVHRAIWWNGLGIGSLLLMCAYAGLTIFAYYGGREGEGWGGIVDGEEGGGGGGGVGCDPLEAGQVESRDQLFPFFVMQVSYNLFKI